jgi:hypothetical protein
VGGVLEAMAARHASGILVIEGDPAGTFYFDQGQITCARASWIPDIGARLLGTLGGAAESPDLLARADEPDRDIGTLLVQQNRLTAPELAAILRSVVVDAVIAMTAFAYEGAYISDVRFASAGPHWAAAFSRQDVHSVMAEAIRRGQHIARYRLGRSTPVRLRDLSGSAAVLSRTQWALACAIDGAASPQELAGRCGLALYDAIENIGELVAAGLCWPDAAGPPGPPAGPPEPPARPAADRPELLAGPLAEWPGPVPPLATLPRRGQPAPVLPAPSVVAAQFTGADLGPMRIEMTPAGPDILRRVLDGLKRTS